MAYQNGAPNPDQQYEAKKQNLRRLDDETRSGISRLQERIDTLREEREDAQRNAATHAGNIGFVYKAETNEHIRVSSGIEEPEMPDAPPPLVLDQARFDSVAKQMEATEREASVELEKREQPVADLPAENDKWYRSIPEWTIAVLVGTFIGYGLGKITGLPIDQQPIMLGLFLTLGAGVIIGLKLLLHKMWEEYGRSVRRQTASKWLLALFTALSAVFCVAEAALGANALVTYSRRVSFTAEDALSFWIALLVAGAISTPILLYSAFKGYGKGVRTLTIEDERVRMDAARAQRERIIDESLAIRKESARRQIEMLEKQFEADLTAKQESHALKMREYEAECLRRREDHEKEKREYEHYKSAPDYEAMLSYIGRVGALNLQIADTEKRLTSYKIGRGYERASKGSESLIEEAEVFPEVHRESA
ncbi:MAG: hypothetical protein ABIV13_05195 [Fimbriimonadales bacterium]